MRGFRSSYSRLDRGAEVHDAIERMRLAVDVERQGRGRSRALGAQLRHHDHLQRTALEDAEIARDERAVAADRRADRQSHGRAVRDAAGADHDQDLALGRASGRGRGQCRGARRLGEQRVEARAAIWVRAGEPGHRRGERGGDLGRCQRLLVVAERAVALAEALEHEAGEIGAERLRPGRVEPLARQVVARDLEAARFDGRALEVAHAEVVQQVQRVHGQPFARRHAIPGRAVAVEVAAERGHAFARDLEHLELGLGGREVACTLAEAPERLQHHAAFEHRERGVAAPAARQPRLVAAADRAVERNEGVLVAASVDRGPARAQPIAVGRAGEGAAREQQDARERATRRNAVHRPFLESGGGG